MNNHLAQIIKLSTIILLLGCQSQETRLEQAMQKSTAWLWSQQGEDGGWHSQTHTVLSDGKALTPYILFHLLQIPENKFERPDQSVEKGVAFVRRNILASMSMSRDSLQLLNYPNYSAAYALRVLCHVHQDTMLQRILFNHLLHEQFIEHRGINPDHLAYGGWGYGEPDLPFGQHGHVDVSHTRRILEALVEAKARGNFTPASSGAIPLKGGFSNLPSKYLIENKLEKSFSTAIKFLDGVQRSRDDERLYEGCSSRKNLPYDGGFISSTVTLATNKSQPILIDGAGYHYPSYATATCDGLLALHALGKSGTPAYKDAVHWLQQHQNMHTIDGLKEDDPEQWYQIMHYYHLAVRAEAMTVAKISGSWSKEIAKILIDEQTEGVYYINPIGGVNKEDDPLMATIFAVQAGWELIQN